MRTGRLAQAHECSSGLLPIVYDERSRQTVPRDAIQFVFAMGGIEAFLRLAVHPSGYFIRRTGKLPSGSD